MRRTRPTAVFAAALLSAALVAGCGSDGDGDAAPSPSVTSETPSRTPSSPSSAPSSPDSSPASPAATGPEAALLTDAELPQLNEVTAWQLQDTGPALTEPFGLCQKVDMSSIGATDAIERSWTTESDDSAGQQVVTFPDEQTARRASKVLQAWHDDCARRLRDPSLTVKVRPITAVPVPTGTGWHYLVSTEHDDIGNFHAFGVVLDGTRMTLLKMDHGGQDHNYEPGQDPMELAVAVAAAKLVG